MAAPRLSIAASDWPSMRLNTITQRSGVSELYLVAHKLQRCDRTVERVMGRRRRRREARKRKRRGGFWKCCQKRSRGGWRRLVLMVQPKGLLLLPSILLLASALTNQKKTKNTTKLQTFSFLKKKKNECMGRRRGHG